MNVGKVNKIIIYPIDLTFSFRFGSISPYVCFDYAYFELDFDPSKPDGRGDSYVASHEMSLDNRYGNNYVNDVFKDNILLTLRYLEGTVTEADKISWEAVEKPLMYWVAKDAGLEAVSPVNHNFAVVPEVSREYGVSISFRPGETYRSALQNLYITNNKDNPVSFVFEFNGEDLKISVKETKLI